MKRIVAERKVNAEISKTQAWEDHLESRRSMLTLQERLTPVSLASVSLAPDTVLTKVLVKAASDELGFPVVCEFHNDDWAVFHKPSKPSIPFVFTRSWIQSATTPNSA